MGRNDKKSHSNVYPFRPPRPREVSSNSRLQARDSAKTILVVDDQQVVLELVDAFLEASEYRVYLAGSGRQALELCSRVQGAIDLLLTDVRMPDMNGPQLYDRIVEKYPDVKILYMSGFSASEAARFGVPANASLIVKPFRPAELLQRIQRAIAGVLEFSAARPVATRP